MTTYDLQTVTALAAAQFDGTDASITAIQAICRDAKADPTMERTVRIPVGNSHNSIRTMYVGDWVVLGATGKFTIMDNTTFTTLLTATP